MWSDPVQQEESLAAHADRAAPDHSDYLRTETSALNAAYSIKHTSKKTLLLNEINGTDVSDVRCVTYSPGRPPCASPDRCGPTASARRSTWPYSRSSWLRGRSERCAAPCPAVHKHGTEFITYSTEDAVLTHTHQSLYSHHILR